MDVYDDDDNGDETKTDTENDSETDTMLSIIKPIAVDSNCLHTHIHAYVN